MVAVSASDLVRHFGEWQERAVEAPIYIQHHGRARLVLASVGYIDALTDNCSVRDEFAAARDALLDVIDSIVVLTDATLSVVGMSAPARRYFGCLDWRGKVLADIFPDATRVIAMRATQRVRDSNVTESFELRMGPRAERRLDVTVQPFASGVALSLRDCGISDERIESAAIADAVRQAIGLIGTVALVRLNLRGYVTEATPSLEAMTGLSLDALKSVRAVTLFDVASRAQLGGAIEQVIEEVAPRCVDAKLTVNRGEAIDVRVALSAEALRSSVETIVATIAVI